MPEEKCGIEILQWPIKIESSDGCGRFWECWLCKMGRPNLKREMKSAGWSGKGSFGKQREGCIFSKRSAADLPRFV